MTGVVELQTCWQDLKSKKSFVNVRAFFQPFNDAFSCGATSASEACAQLTEISEQWSQAAGSLREEPLRSAVCIGGRL